MADKNGTFNKKELLYNVEYALMDKYNGFAPVKKTVDYTDKYKNDVFLNNIEIIREGGRYFKSEDFEHVKLFFVFDSEFNVPKSSIIVRIITLGHCYCLSFFLIDWTKSSKYLLIDN